MMKLNFITESQYKGQYNESLNCMNGFGTYTYPDGSQYRGYFKNGKFHGFGYIKLASPYKVIYKGVFERGKLVSVEDMIFSDGLRVDTGYENKQIDFDKWDYCSDKDRRYQPEIRLGIQPVGPDAYLTKDRPTAPIKRGDYDVGGGFYVSGSGFIVQRPKPFSSLQFIGCASESHWILKHCRSGICLNDQITSQDEPNEYITSKILKTNLQQMKYCLDDPKHCSCINVDDQRVNELVDKTSYTHNPYSADDSSGIASSLSDNSLDNNLKLTV